VSIGGGEGRRAKRKASMGREVGENRRKKTKEGEQTKKHANNP